MVQRLISAIISPLLLLAMLVVPVSLASTGTAYATDSKQAACEGIGLSGGSCDSNASNKVGNVVSTIVNLLSVIVGIAAVIMIIVSGFRYITSGGDSNSVASAKSSLIYAIVGLVIVALAQFIVNFVLKQTN